MFRIWRIFPFFQFLDTGWVYNILIMTCRINIVAISWPGWSYDLSWENLRNVFTRVKILYIAALTQWIVLHFVFIKQQSASSVSSRLRQTHDWLKVYDQRRTWHLLADALGRDSSEELANWLALPDCSCNGKNLFFQFKRHSECFKNLNVRKSTPWEVRNVSVFGKEGKGTPYIFLLFYQQFF